MARRQSVLSSGGCILFSGTKISGLAKRKVMGTAIQNLASGSLNFANSEGCHSLFHPLISGLVDPGYGR